MRAYIPSYRLISPASLGEALDVLARDNGVWKPFAGGTDLMVLLEAGKLPHKNYVNIWNLKELRGIEVSDDRVTLGALTTYTEIQNHKTLREEFPMLCQAASETGGCPVIESRKFALRWAASRRFRCAAGGLKPHYSISQSTRKRLPQPLRRSNLRFHRSTICVRRATIGSRFRSICLKTFFRG